MGRRVEMGRECDSDGEVPGNDFLNYGCEG